jgi:hypothetical protein
MTPRPNTEVHDAHLQLAIGVLTMAVAGLAWQIYALMPAGAGRLAVPIAELRSQAAELELLQREVIDARIPDRFMRLHLQQLGDDSARSFAALTRLNVKSRLAGAHAQARRAALAIQLELADLAAGDSPRPDAAQEQRQRLVALERTLAE